MFQSMRIGRWLGIDVFVHPTFWLLPLLVLFGGSAARGPDAAALELAVVFATFGCVALHEFGHAVAARGYGIGTRDITLYPIGGVARLEGMPDRPWHEIVVALAGPAVNVAIAAFLGAVMLLDGVDPVAAVADGPGLEAFWVRLLTVNVGLVAFNLIPAFPMDGGRVLRAAASWFTDRVTATEVASVVGGVFAVLIGLAGLASGNFLAVVVAGMVFLMGRAEAAGVRHQEWQRQADRRQAARLARYGVDIPVVFPAGGLPVARRAVVPRPDGWEHDPATGLWTEWRDGVAVRRVRAE